MARIVIAVFVTATSLFVISQVFARPQYKEVFESGYRLGNPQTKERRSLAEKVRVARCNVCHVPDEKKTVRNIYGDDLAGRLPRFDAMAWKDERKVPALRRQVWDAMLNAEATKRKNGYTFGDYIRAGHLPSE